VAREIAERQRSVSRRRLAVYIRHDGLHFVTARRPVGREVFTPLDTKACRQGSDHARGDLYPSLSCRKASPL